MSSIFLFAQSNFKNYALLLSRVFLALFLFYGITAQWAEAAPLDNENCLACHKKNDIEVPLGKDETRNLSAIHADKMAAGVHGKMQCVTCHVEIQDAKENHHIAKNAVKPKCLTCHQSLAEKSPPATDSRLAQLLRNGESYQHSFHAKPDKDYPDRPMAYCSDCHNSHDFAIPRAGTPEREAWRKNIPKLCGASCHEEQLEIFTDSVHGVERLEKNNLKAPVCIDCHGTHTIIGTSTEAFKLANVDACGQCHKENINSYADTYHGQVHRLGYSYTARCVNCHDSHGIRRVDDPKSTVHINNRLKTCQKCHSSKKPGMHDATPGFISFHPHANTHDFAKYPQMYIASKFMIALLFFVFLFFWAHSGLWYYREWQERKAGKTHQRIATDGLSLYQNKHVLRFALGWRIGHLLFALVTMTLVITGTTALFAESSWAPALASLVGGPAKLGLIHRTAAFLFVGIFLVHFVYVMQKLLRNRKFRWFGPDSLIPNWKDVKDCWQMFKWFFGKGEKPVFDRWTYFEKFDYWAVFWGVNVIGWSGLMLAFPHVTADYLPGWIFNVATLVHGEEAFLAAVFLFTVHFFNNHFRPEKLPPPDIVMFTGTQSLSEFAREHPGELARLMESGELEKRLVDAPSAPFALGSKILGVVLLGIGLLLLILVINGFLVT